MKRFVLALLLSALPVCLALPGCRKDVPPTVGGDAGGSVSDEVALDPKWPTIRLNGELMSVRWSDGDSFKFKSGRYEGKGVRLTGYNTLESYGPVHRWGTWTGVELYRIAKSSWKLGASSTWSCTTDEELDHYGRVLVDCPDAALHLVGEGHAFVFGLDASPDGALMRAQRVAMKKGVGIWAKGAPKQVISSLHSADEGEGGLSETYNRVVDTATGESTQARHKSTYATCQEVCLGGDTGSCMVYVPFSNRYKNKADCLYVTEKGVN